MNRNIVIFGAAIAFLMLVFYLLQDTGREPGVVEETSTHTHEDGVTHTH